MFIKFPYRRLRRLIPFIATGLLATAIGFGVAPHPPVESQPVTYAHFLDWPNAVACSGVQANAYGVQFPVNPVHNLFAYDRNGDFGTCSFNGGGNVAAGGNITAAGNAVITGNITGNNITALGIFSGSGAGLTNIPNSGLVGPIVTNVSGGDNIVAAPQNSAVVVAVASPTSTAAPIPAYCIGFYNGAAPGGPLAAYTCPPSPYPTPATPYPTPTVTSANSNCTTAGLVITCAQTLQAAIVMTLPTGLASTGATTFPVPVDPYWTNIQSTGAASSCATAGTGTPETFVFLESTSSQGTYVTAVPTTFVLATGNAPGVVETIAPTAFVSPTPNGGFIVAKVLAQSGTTARSGVCTYTLFVSHL